MKEQPRTVRLKSYTAETGLVYQYYFVGKRRSLDGPATEFVFDVSSDRHVRFSVNVFVADEVLAAWRRAHGRELLDAEIYAAAKMRLLRGFDEVEKLFEQGRRLEVENDEFEELLGTLGLE